MPVKPDSRFSTLSVLRVLTPDGTFREVVALRLELPPNGARLNRHLVTQGETVDLLSQRFYGDEGLWWRILDVNPEVYPLDVQAGDMLNLPNPGPATSITRARRV